MSIIKNLQTDENGWITKGMFISNSIFQGEMKIEIFVNDGATVEYAEDCIRHYNELIDKDELCVELQKRLIKYFLYMYDNIKEIGMYDEIVDNMESVMEGYKACKNFIDYLDKPTLYVYAPRGNGIGYGIEFECPWEEENNCLIIIRNDEILYVGPSEGLDAWREKDEYYCIWDN